MITSDQREGGGRDSTLIPESQMIRGERRECAGKRGAEKERCLEGRRERESGRGNILISPSADLDRTGSKMG